MDTKTFTELLSKYRVVRSRDAELPRLQRRAGRTPASSAGGSLKDGAASAAAAAPTPISAADFWAGLTPYLERQYGAAGAKAVSASFDAMHYASLRALNYEDVEDLSAMLARELGLEVGGAGAAGPSAE